MSVTEQQVIDALSTVNDPEIKKDLVSLSMIDNVKVDGSKVSFTVVLTTPACPLKQTIKEDCEKAVKAIDGVETVEVEFSSKVLSSVQQDKEELIPNVKNTILVGSGKGGVGKSTVALNLACSLALDGAKVGIMDADVYGPSIPTMLGAEGAQLTGSQETEKVYPIEAAGIKAISLGFMVDRNSPVLWRGPMLGNLITQFLRDVEWGELDYLIIDLPPGTGDVQLTLAQSINASGAVLVTTPQDVALSDVYRAKLMFDKVNINTLGILENMSGFQCPDCGSVHQIFNTGGGEKAAKDLNIKLLGKIPIHTTIAESGDNGVPAVISHQDTAYSKSIREIARSIAGKISLQAINK